MKRAILMATLTLSLTLGSVRMYAFPNNPCAPTVSPSAATSVSVGQALLLLLPILLPTIG